MHVACVHTWWLWLFGTTHEDVVGWRSQTSWVIIRFFVSNLAQVTYLLCASPSLSIN